MTKQKKKQQQEEKIILSSKRQYCLHALQVFKHWSEADRKKVINFYYRVYGNLLKTDENAVLIKIHQAIDRTSEEQKKKGKNRYDFSSIHPGFLFKICKQLALVTEEGKRVSKKAKKTIKDLLDFNVDVDELNDAISGLSVEMENFDKKTSEEKISELLDRYRKNLTKAGYEILVKLASVALDDSKRGKIIIDEIAKQYGLKPNTFTKNISRLREQVQEDEMRGMLSLVLTKETATERHLKIYRFSGEELDRMLSLKKLFEENHFSIERFPEVYYDTYDRYCDAYGCEKQEEDSNYDWLADMNPDKLGVYRYRLIDADCHLSKEGVIILFSDRIEKFCERRSLDKCHVRLIVLLHELGHWLCHWPEDTGNKSIERWLSMAKNSIKRNWNYGYDWNYLAGNIKTHEILAKLIAYWSVKGKANLKDILMNQLSPADSQNPYSLYKQYLGKEKKEMIRKIIDLRKHFFLSDELACEYLSGNFENMKAFYDEKQDGFNLEGMGLNRIMEIWGSSSSKQSDFFSRLHSAYGDFSEPVKKQIEEYLKLNEVQRNPFTNTRGDDLEKKLLGT